MSDWQHEDCARRCAPLPMAFKCSGLFVGVSFVRCELDQRFDARLITSSRNTAQRQCNARVSQGQRYREYRYRCCSPSFLSRFILFYFPSTRIPIVQMPKTGRHPHAPRRNCHMNIKRSMHAADSEVMLPCEKIIAHCYIWPEIVFRNSHLSITTYHSGFSRHRSCIA